MFNFNTEKIYSISNYNFIFISYLFSALNKNVAQTYPYGDMQCNMNFFIICDSLVASCYLHGVYIKIMRKTLKNRNTEFPPSAAAAERLADYKGEGNLVGKRIKLSCQYFLINLCEAILILQGVTNLTSPELDIHFIIPVSEMPEVNEGNPVPSSSYSSKDNKASGFELKESK